MEKYEWCDFWWEDADDFSVKRVLLIGDSITRGYRPFVNRNLNGIACVDMLATSKSSDSKLLKYEIDYVLSVAPYQYDVIHINNGLHGFHQSKSEYMNSMEELASYLKEKAKDSQLIIATSTPITQKEDVEKLDEALNSVVLERNSVVSYISEKYNLVLNDLYGAMLGKGELRIGDGYHYNKDGEEAQGIIVSNLIKQYIK